MHNNKEDEIMKKIYNIPCMDLRVFERDVLMVSEIENYGNDYMGNDIWA